MPSLDFQSIFRFLIPGFIFLFSLTPLIKIRNIPLHLLSEKFAVALAPLSIVLAFVFGVMLFWIYYVIGHICRKEKEDMQKKESEWLTETEKNYDHSSNLIWHYMESNESDKNTSKWFRNNFALMHSLGGCLAAIILGTAICLVKAIWYHFHDCCFIGYWLACVAFLSLIICKYRNELKSRYLARLRIYILSHKVAIQNCEKEKHTNKENTRFSGRFSVH